MEVRCVMLPCGYVWIPHCWNFMKLPNIRHGQLLNPFPEPLPSLEDGGGGAENSKLLIMAWFFQRSGLIQELSKSQPIVISLEQKTLLSPRKLQGFQECSVKNWGETYIYVIHTWYMSHIWHIYISCIYIYVIYMPYKIKDTDKQSRQLDEEIHRVRSGKVSRVGNI